MSDEPTPEQNPEPPHFREFDELYHTLIKCHWHDPVLKDHIQRFEAFLSKHGDLYQNRYVIPCINNARGHCKGSGLPYRF